MLETTHLGPMWMKRFTKRAVARPLILYLSSIVTFESWMDLTGTRSGRRGETYSVGELSSRMGRASSGLGVSSKGQRIYQVAS